MQPVGRAIQPKPVSCGTDPSHSRASLPVTPSSKTSGRCGPMTFAVRGPVVSIFSHDRILKRQAMPQIGVALVSSTGALCGIGEVGVPCVASAMAKTQAKLTGTRVCTRVCDPGAIMSGGWSRPRRTRPGHPSLKIQSLCALSAKGCHGFQRAYFLGFAAIIRAKDVLFGGICPESWQSGSEGCWRQRHALPNFYQSDIPDVSYV